MSTAVLPFRMPMRNVPGAPVFSPDKPQTINAFFEDLEFLFTEAAITDDQIKKGHAVRYAPEPDKDLWRAFESFQAKDKSGKVQTYDDFKAEVLRLYLGKDGKRLHSLSDLNAVVITTTQSTMRSTSEFSAYSRKFRLVGDYLVKHDVLRADDRDRLFVRGLPDALRTKVLERLKYTCPDVLAPRTPYTVQQVTDATEFVLNAQDEDVRLLYTPHALGVITTTSASTAAPPATVPATTDSGQLPDMIAALTEAMRTLSYHASSTPPQTSTPATTPAARQRPPHMTDDSTTTPPRIAGCFYCGETGHAIRACPHAETDIAAGIIARNAQGQVVLGSGQYVPKAIQGQTLRARVQEYYRIYPESRPHISNVAPTTQLLFQPVLRHPIYATQRRPQPQQDDESDAQHDLRKERDERARKRIVRFEEPPEVARLPPVPSARIEELPDEPTISSAPHTNAHNGDTSSDTSNDAQRSDRIQLPGTARSTTRGDPSASSPNASRRDDIPIPEHPFANARDATYAPPRDRTFGAPPPRPAPPAKKGDPAYRSIAPIYDQKHAANVFKRCLEAPISITQEELLALSPEIRQATREACSTRRVQVSFSDTLPFDSIDDIVPDSTRDRSDTFLASMPSAYVHTTRDKAYAVQQDVPPPGAIVVEDPVDQLLRSLPPGAHTPSFHASLESSSIRAIDGLFQHDTTVCCILDSGSAIISMSEGLCHSLGLAYDPTIILEMQSANGECDYSLGLARNVRVHFGSITVYLQFHVIRSPAYDVLLGRPFDVLTESLVKTYRDGSQVITIHDPNADARATIPSLPRRDPEFVRAKPVFEKGFRERRCPQHSKM